LSLRTSVTCVLASVPARCNFPGGGSGTKRNPPGRPGPRDPEPRRSQRLSRRDGTRAECGAQRRGGGAMDSSQNTPVEQRHLPVLLDTSVELLTPALRRPGAVHIDATLGMGGHATAVLDAAPEARLVGIDRDAEALALARERIGRAGHAERATLVHATYDDLPEVLEELGLDGAD